MPYCVGMTFAALPPRTISDVRNRNALLHYPSCLARPLRAGRHCTFSDGRNLDRNKGEF